MPIVEYTPDHFEGLQKMVRRVPRPMNLAHKPFVDYYYASREWCRLYLFLSHEGEVVGTLGRELLPFEVNRQVVSMRMGTNWFSLQPGVGSTLSKHSAMSNPNSYGLVLMASGQAVKILKHMQWVPVPGVTGYFLNGCSLAPWNTWWKSAANLLVRYVGGKRISGLASRVPVEIASRLHVKEEFSYSADLLPERSPFSFRFAPSMDYLSWRYNLALSFVRYRLFRILAEKRSVGYVILNDSPEQIIVAQCDADDPIALGYGTILAILEAGKSDRSPRTAYLTCCHAEMRHVFEDFGFKKWFRSDLPFGFLKVPPNLDLAFGTSEWLVNYDWSDNGFQGPFWDRPSDPTKAAVQAQ